MNFKDKVVWITGASSGIGEGLAYALANEGAKLAISSRNETELERVKGNCPQGIEVEVIPMDVSHFDRVPIAAQRVLDRFGFINILINNAGISQRDLVKDTVLEVDKKLMDVNYLGTVAVTKAVLPAMIQQRFGHIVTISSVLGKYGVAYRSGYSASKHALHGFFDSLRAELEGEQVDITLICPGYVRTNVTINALKGDGSKNNVMAESTAAGMEPAEFARKALRAISRRSPEVYIGGKEAVAIYLKRFVPGLFRRIIARQKLE
jgi:short-subunit dehydrogenase